MELAMARGFSELNEQEMMEVDGGSIAAIIAGIAVVVIGGGCLFAGCNAGKEAGKKQFEAEMEEEKYKNPTPVPTPTPIPTPTPVPTPTPIPAVFV